MMKKPVTDAAAPDRATGSHRRGQIATNCNLQLIYCNMRLLSRIESTVFSETFVV